jgi:uncharacterized protein (DUF3820 family)
MHAVAGVEWEGAVAGKSRNMIEYPIGKGSWDDDMDDSIPPIVDANPDVYTDRTIMPFGKHKGKMLSQVPGAYLIWLLDNQCSDSKLKRYINDNMDSLSQEAAVRKS